MQLKFAKLGALFSRFYSALRTPRFALALALAFAALAPFCGHAAIPLPDGYRRIAYIESSVAGQQYIQLDYIKYRFQIPNEITIKGMYTAAASTFQSPCGFSTQGGSLLSLNPQSQFGNDASEYLGFVFDGNKMIQPSSPVTINWKVGRVSTDPVIGDKLEVTYADGSSPSASCINAPLASDYEKPLTLLAVPLASGSGMSNFSNFRLYGATVKQNGELTADLVPVLNPSDVPGLWDNVTGQFLTTQGATPFVHPQPEQWFRFTLLKKYSGVTGGGIHIGELALYTADNVNVAEGLNWHPGWYKEVSELNARNTAAGSFSFTGPMNKDADAAQADAELRWQAQLFDGKFGTGSDTLEYCGSVLNASDTLNYTFTMHLDSTKGEVVKYNLMSGKDVSVHSNYALTEWTLERSYDGVNWEYVDEQRDRNTSGWTAQNNTWYRDGGTVQNANPGVIADHPPTNFYWLFDLPLPKLSRTVYAHTGAPISPEIVEQSQYCTLSGDTNATQVGKYKIVCTPEPGLAWENGSTEPCELEWEIVNDPFPLPADYTRLEWIKSTRQQRLVTDYYPNPKTWMEVDCMFTGLFDGDGGSFASPNCTSKFCDANEGVALYSIAFTGTRGYFNMLICWVDQSDSGGIWLNSASFPQAGDISKAVDESVCRNLLTISNGVSNSTLEWTKAGLAIERGTKGPGIERTIPRKTTTCTTPLALFGTAEKNFGTYDMTVWSWKIYESDSGSGVNDPTSHLVHNFIPAKDPDGVPGLWDTVTGEFRASATDTPFEYQTADQWFRLSITQVAAGKSALSFSEFALYDAAGVRQNLNLAEASSIDNIGPGKFYHDKKGGTIWASDEGTVLLFDGKLGPEQGVTKSRMGITLKEGTYDSTGKITDPQVLIMHLTNGAPEVVKYNLATGEWGVDYSPTGWILERSYDGRNWTEIIRKTDATSEYATGASSWYRNGGGGAAPTTFYPAGNWGEGADQWFRLTIRKKYAQAGDERSLQLDEFALFDAEGKRQDLGLEPNGVSAASLLPGEWYYEGRGDADGNPTKFWGGQTPSKLFDRNLATKWGVDYEPCDLNPLGQGDEAYWQVLTLRLPVGTSEVVSYNLCSGFDTGNFNSRAPTSWVLERSSDGINWVVFDEKTEADHQYTLESSTWYGNGGTENDPTNVFWIVKLPLPKLGQTVYSYTGAPISPKMMEESEFYTLSGDTNATAVGTYKLVCTPISDLTWANGSTGPYELVWQIVPETFLQRIVNDSNNQHVTETDYASGGDIVLKIGNEYVHVFTNGIDRTFTAKTELANARLLLVGGGGSGGSAFNGHSGAGGGAGGLVEMVTGISASDYRIDVGAGAQPGANYTGKNGSDSAFGYKTSADNIALAKGGGGGGSSAITYFGGANLDYAIGLGGGSGGGHSVLLEALVKEPYPSAGWFSPASGVDGQGHAGGMAYATSANGCSGAGGGGAGGAGAACTTNTVGGVGGIGRVSDILGWSAFFAGGGAGASGTGNNSSNGGVGGGGSSCSHTMLNRVTDAERALIMNGSDGQGGGGAGATSWIKDTHASSGKGGSGIVIIRYQIPDTTLLATPPVAKTGLTYNGKTQVGVPEGVGYTLKEAYYYATAVGTYTTTATLLPGYVWNDNGSTAPREYEWMIEGLRISSVKLVANEAQWTGSDIIPQVASVTTVDGLTFTDASVGWKVSHERERVATDNLTDIGNVSVVVTGKGSLSGEARANFRIYDPHKIPLPKPSLAVYKYTGFAITPTFDPSWARDGYTTSGTLSATEKGTYTVTCTLKTGYQWENGSTMPYDVQWVIGDSFLERLASDPRRVNGALVTDYDTGYAVGGDLVLFDSETSEYIHVFTNTADAATFTPSANLNARVLLVGGGGGGGGENGGGGGAGGMVEDAGLLLPGNQDITVVVGKGAAGVNAGVHGDDGTSSQIVVPGVKPVVAYGGGGGGAAQWNAAVDHNVIDGHGGNGFGSGGGGSSCSGSAIAVGLPGLSTTTYNDVKQGNDGGAANDNASYPAGGGGGAGEPGETSDSYNRKSGRHYESGENIGGFGGNGRVSDILGAEFTEQYFAGGGGGGGGDGSLERVAKGGMGGGGNGAEGDYSSTPLRAAKVAQPGENGLGGGGGGGKGGQSSSYLKKGAAGGDGIVIIRYSAPNAREVAPVPESWLTVRKLFANGKTQVGVESASRGSTLSGDYYGDAAGTYTAVATLAPGYTKWSDDSTALSREITWEIYVPSVVASAEDVEQEYDGTSHSITVTVTDPADATVTYSLTEDGEYTGTNPSFTEFGAYRVYWKASKDNYTGAKGSAVVRIGKKAAGEYVRLTVTKRKGVDSAPEGQGGGDFELGELALYDARGTRLNSGLALATEGLAQLKATSGTCYSFPTNWYGGQGADKLFNENKSSPVKLCCPRNSTSSDSADAHIQIYMHLSDENADKVICSYNLQSGDDVANSQWRGRSPTEWRLEVSSDCERWTIIDEKTVADTKDDHALNTNNTWYNGGVEHPYRINLNYVPMEVLETNPYAEGDPRYSTVSNYVQIVGFQLEADDVVTAKVRYNDTTHAGDGIWDTLFCQRDLGKNGNFSLHRQFADMLGAQPPENQQQLRFDYGDGKAYTGKGLVSGLCEFIVSASGVKTNGAEAIAAPTATWKSAPNNSLLLFASDNPSLCDGVPAHNPAYLQCYYFQVADSAAAGSPLRLDLMPASNTVTHAHGLYDRMSGSFYPLQKVAEAGQQPFTSATIASHYAKPMTVKMNDAGWDQLPILTEVDERLASVTNYLTSIPNYWQQEWVPGVVDHAGEYRQILRGQGPYAGEVTNVYAVGIEVALNANGGMAGATNSVLAVPGRPLPAITGTGALPTKSGCLFLGYWTEAEGGEKYYNADGTSAMEAYPVTDAPTTLYAHWLEGYESLAKLNFDGKHFILTDYIPKATTWIETEMRTNGTQITGCAALFGMAERFEGDSVDSVYGMNLSAYGSSVYGWVLGVNDSLGGKGRGWLLNDSKLVFSDKCKVRFGYFGFTLSDGSSTFEGAERPQWHKDNRFPCHTKVVIGGYNGFLPLGGEGNLGYGTPVRPYSFTSGGLDVYSFNIYESANGSPADAEQTLKHNFIPVTNTTDKVAGLYDIVGQKFYPLQTQTVVTLNANGGNQATNYVYATAGEKMPSPIEVPTRQGYTFAGYSAEGWEVKPMTGKETDFISEGTGIWAYRAYNGSGTRTVVNGTEFFHGLLTGTNQGPDATRQTDPVFTTDVGFNEFSETTVGGEFTGCSQDYTRVVSKRIEFQDTKDPRHDRVTFTLRQGLVAGKSYAVQIISYHKTTNTDAAPNNEPTNRLGFCENVYYENCAPVNPMGVSFVYRFKATGSTQSFTLYKPTEVKSASKTAAYLSISAIQLRELGSDVEDENPLLYYNAAGTSDKTYPAANGPTTLYAQWELANYPITYEGLEGADNPDNPTGYTVNDELVLRAPGKRDGYVFGGWKVGETPISYIPKNTTGAKTLTANWVSTNAYQLIEYIATTNCQFLDTGVTPRNAHFGFALDFWDQCHVSSDKAQTLWNSARIIGSSKLAPGKEDGCFSGFFFGNWNQGGNAGQLVLCSDYGSGYYPVNPHLTSESRLRVKLVNDYEPTGITTNPDHSYSLYTVKRVADDGTETSITPDQYYEHKISGASDPYQDMPEWFAGSVYVGAVNRESQYQTPEGLGYGGTRNNHMRFYRVTFYYDDIVLYDAIPAIDADGHVGLLRVDGAEGEVFAYSKTIDETWLAQTGNPCGAEFATPFFKVNGNGGLPEETTFVRLLDGSTQPALIEDLIPTRDGFTLMGFTNATGRVYQLDGDNKFVDVPQDGETVYARWFASGDYELLPCLDNGSSLDTAGYVALTNFRLTGANVVELKYCVNAENDDKWQGVFWSRMPEKSYSLVLRNRNHSSGCKWQVTYGVEGATVSTYDRPIIGTDYVLRLCPTAVGDKGLLGYLDGNPVSWELYNASAMFEDEAQVDTLLFAAGRIDPLVNDEPSRDVAGKMTGPALAKMYYFRVENSATDPTLRLDLVPVRKKATGVRGFCDLVNGNFYPLKTPVVLDGNGGEPSPQYVYTSKGEAMPALPNKPTRADYSFLGYYGGDGTKYYDENGAPVRACDFEESATSLSAHWLFTNTQARQELEEAFDAETTGTTVEPVIVDGAIASYTVVLARDYPQGVTLPSDLGPVTIDLNGWTICGINGVDGATTTVGGESLAGTDGGPAITVAAASGADAGVTAITVTEVWAEYMIIDLRLSGPESVSYEVAYSFDEATNRYNTLEYKTDKIVFRKIPACTFTMGSPEDEVGRAKDKTEYWRNPETQHEVTLTQDYYIGLFPVTRRQWKLVMGSCPSDADDETRPVGSVTYQMIRGSGDGIDVSKLASGGLVGDDGFLAALRAKSGLDYLDLPSEAQWECAARAGTTTSTFFGDNVQNWSAEDVSPYLWYSGNTSGHDSHGVGQVIPNHWGLYDTLGNVWEWCLDRVTCAPDDDLGREAVTDPLRKEEGGRVPARGGKTDDNLDYSRSAARDGNSVVNRTADAATPNYGLRLAGICPVDEDNGRPAAGTSSAVIGGNGGNGYPPGKGSPAVTDTTGAKVTVTDPLTLVSDGNDGERWAYDLHVIRDEAGAPTVVVPMAWLKDANPESEVSESAYQAEFLKTNASGVVEWQAYVLGFAADKWSDAAIAEETVQNADPKTVTIRLRDMSAEPRTNATTRLAYSLLSARTPAGFADGGGTVVTNLAEEAYYKWPESTFEAPLSDLSDENPVNYYRIKIHFIFGGGGEVLLESAGVVTTTTPGWTASGNDMIADVTLPDSFAAGGKYLKVEFKGAADYAMGLQAVIFLNADGKEISTVNDGLYTNDRSSPFAYTHAYRVPVGASRVQVKFTPSTQGSDPTQASIQIADVVLSSISETEACAVEEAAFNQMDTALLSTVEGSTMPSAETLKANLPGLVNALKNGTEYKILMLTCPLSTYLNSGLLEEMVRNAFPGSKIKFSYYTRGSNDCAEYFEADLNESTGVFSGSKMSVSMMDVDCIMMHSASYYRISTPSYSTDLEKLIDKCKRVKPDVEFAFVSPLYSVESRFNWGDVGLASYDAGPLYNKFDQEPLPYTNKDMDQWVKRSHPVDARKNVSDVCSQKNVGYWELYDVAYDYVWQCGKPIGWFNQGGFGGYQLNERGRQLNVHILIDAFKRLAACSD